ncbi:MAG: peptidase M16 [Desulfobacterales bacterium CG23_combo_of_CG06-09_8_20_14_all_51_8]|nr:MAG: peptidase M16 [Desulfobacterales bacterium CG23_combo_of_CG06-09_8_20_14_all_51_8]
MDPLNPDLKPGDELFGYKILKIIELPEIKSFFYELIHDATGARHIHISRPDTENTFAVTFKTVPSDSTGVAHILEHTVLCGSEKYPVRDPFFSMIKRSLNTFMNALTASDWTMYPFSTQNEKDYYNLMGVYLDAAFFPKLDRLSFKQEGHRLEFEPDDASPDSPNGQALDMGRLSYKGVVYNEMKGAMSSPDQVMSRSILNALYPDTTYGFNSGGDPAHIPGLTHEELLAFHRHHYHPSNAYFYTYGNSPLAPRLRFIEANILSRFTRIDPKTEVRSQPRWDAPRQKTYYYPLDGTDDPSKKAQVCLAWLTADIRDAFEVLSLTVLDDVLMGNSGSPLRKALMESGLGSTLADGSSYDSENKDTMFACGLKDVDPASADAIEKIIFDTLSKLASDGIDKELVDSAIHQIEFYRKEITNTPYPYGIKLLLRISGDWFHHGDPAASLKFDILMDRLSRELASGRFLENQIEKYFLKNPHRARVTLLPDSAMAEKETKQVDEELNRIQKNLSESDIQEIVSDTRALAVLQEAKEDVDSLPTLEISDIDPAIQTVAETLGYPGTDACCYEVPTSGIFYFIGAFGLKSLPKSLTSLAPFFCHSLTLIGTSRRSYHEIARRIDLYTGGIHLSVNAGTDFSRTGEDLCLPVVSFSAKCLSRNLDNMFDIVHELLCEYDFSDTSRLRQLLMEYRSDMESAVVSNGHRFAISLASRTFSTTSALNETWHGIHQLKAVKTLTDGLTDARLSEIAGDLKKIAVCLLKNNDLKIGLIGEKQDIEAAIHHTEILKKNLGTGNNDGFSLPEIPTGSGVLREGWSTASAVSFVAGVFQTQNIRHADAPALAVISKMLRSLFLHREIREKGGAYGGFAVYQLESGLFCFASYRDPHIVNTLKVYGEACDFMVSGDYADEDIKEAILQVCADIDRPDTPNAAAGKAFYRKLTGLTDDIRSAFKQKLMALDRGTVIAAARRYFGPDRPESAVAVISNEEALRQAAGKLKDRPLLLHRI